ncbi:hypothetical protein JQ604_25075 [Bradyrhizobium jicamae]|uniref:hypothetical protein n=1 Tax=Bradyrhizobium jicamae TaxID=280332 RepID=UPI001BA9757C|nr:hypothetical protein [Bradyrhizobium jicamae]MBR0755465.1 hypothetical protein [Bradyrhizobium jicamae]
MRILLSIAAAGFVIASGASAFAGELPSYEVKSFPISPTQVQLLGAAGVQEQTPMVTQTIADMPASPAQIAVLTPHRQRFAEANTTR